MPLDPDALRYGPDGLLPVVVQDIGSGAVLMLAWADRTAVANTLASGEAWFWSRSRAEHWRKGATSGNTLAVADVRADCDHDSLLYRVRPAGPACHTGARSCFESDGREVDARLELGWLAGVVRDRRAVAPEESYTRRLLDAGPPKVAQKVGEESAEVIVAALAQSPERLAEESADLLYHLLVLLETKGVAVETVATELAKRAR